MPLYFVMWVLGNAQLNNYFINMFEYDFSKWKATLLFQMSNCVKVY